MTPYYSDDWLTILQGDCRAVLAELPAESVHCVVTSPPYWGLRDYGTTGQLGLEATPEAYVAAMVEVFREVRRVLRKDGTLWLNLGDSYTSGGRQTRDPGQSKIHAALENWQGGRPENPAGLKDKDLVGIPWRVAFALQADGWYLRSDIIWAKPNPMPESVTDRPTKSHEYLFLLSKSARYYYDAEAVREAAESGPSDLRKMAESRERIGGLVKDQTDPLLKASALTNIGRKRAVGGAPLRGRRPSGWADSDDGSAIGRYETEKGGPEVLPAGRNLRSVWTVATQPYPGAHFATFPRKLVEPCIKAGCPADGTVLDPFAGSGTTGMVAQSLSRRAILIDLNADYLVQAMGRNRDIPLGLVG